MELVLIVQINITGNFRNSKNVLMPEVENKYNAVNVVMDPTAEARLVEKGDLLCVKTGATMPFGDKLLSLDIYKYHNRYWTKGTYIDGNRAF